MERWAIHLTRPRQAERPRGAVLLFRSVRVDTLFRAHQPHTLCTASRSPWAWSASARTLDFRPWLASNACPSNAVEHDKGHCPQSPSSALRIRFEGGHTNLHGIPVPRLSMYPGLGISCITHHDEALSPLTQRLALCARLDAQLLQRNCVRTIHGLDIPQVGEKQWECHNIVTVTQLINLWSRPRKNSRACWPRCQR